MHDDGAELGDGADIPVTFASVAKVVDRGECVWCLLMVYSPEGILRGERWVVFPRSGFMMSLLEAAEKMLPGVELAPVINALVN